ncbi:MAG: PTS sugar transporter subunit IIA [Gemmatimonadales bacterium]
MRLRDFFDPRAVLLDLPGTTRDDVLAELPAILGLDDRARTSVHRLLQRREQLGSTGIGRGVAVPHCRTLAVSRLRLAYGRHRAGIDFEAIDHKPVHHFFLIVAPPAEVANQYLPVLAKIAQLAKEPDVPQRLDALRTAEEFFELLDQKAV